MFILFHPKMHDRIFFLQPQKMKNNVKANMIRVENWTQFFQLDSLLTFSQWYNLGKWDAL